MRAKRLYMFSIGIIVWIALLLQLYLTIQLSISNGQSVIAGLGAYLRYFTVLTNILVALALTAPLWAASSRLGQFFADSSVNTAIAIYIAIVGITYSLLLRNTWNPTGLQLVADHLLHDASPILFVIYWIFFVPKGHFRGIILLSWLLYPVAYFIYALCIGASTGQYAYPFIDAGKLGFTRTLLNAVGILIAGVAVELIFVGMNWKKRGAQGISS